MSPDEQAIRELVETWMRATKEGDVDAILPLMTEDAIFLRAGHEPMRGRAAFKAAFRALPPNALLHTTSKIEDLTILGDVAWLSNEIHISFTPFGEPTVERDGRTLTIFRKNSDGLWQLARDANMMAAPAPPPPTKSTVEMVTETVADTAVKLKEAMVAKFEAAMGSGHIERDNNLTPRAQQVLALARQEADYFNHNYVGTEHVLLGLIKLGQGVAVNVLKELKVDLDRVRQEVLNQEGQGPDGSHNKVIPYTPRVKIVLALAGQEAKNLDHSYVGTEHLLLGLLREKGGMAGRILRSLGVDAGAARVTVLKELDPNFEYVPQSEPDEQELPGETSDSVDSPSRLTEWAHDRTATEPDELVSSINFTPRAQQALALTRKEAQRFCHNYVGTEHLLLGLVKLGQGVAVTVLGNLGVNLESLRLEVEKQVGAGPDSGSPTDIPYTPRVKKVLKLAVHEARELGHSFVGTEHLLLGLIKEGDGVAARVLKSLNVDLASARHQVLKELDPNYPSALLESGRGVSRTAHDQPAKPSPDATPEPARDRTDVALDKLTPAGRRLFALARQEAERFKLNHIQTRHLLLALLQLREGCAFHALQKSGVDLEALRLDVEQRMTAAIHPIVEPGEELIFTPGVNSILADADREAQALGHGCIGAEHILLALLQVEKSSTVHALKRHGANPAQIRLDIISELDPGHLPPLHDLFEGVAAKLAKIEATDPTPTGPSGRPVELTPGAHLALTLARKMATRLYHAEVCPEHLLLGLLDLERDTAAQTLRHLNLHLEDLRLALDEHLRRCSSSRGDLADSLALKKILVAAREEARKLRHRYIGTEHLLLGLLGEQGGAAGRVLKNFGVHPGPVRLMIQREGMEFLPRPGSSRGGSGKASVPPSIDPALRASSAHLHPPEDSEIRSLPFTIRAQQLLDLANREASRLDHPQVDAAHLLIALFNLGSGVGLTALTNLKVNLGEVRFHLLGDLSEKLEPAAASPLPTFSPRAKAVMTLASKEARSLGHAYIGTEHILLGIIRQDGGVAAEALWQSGVDLEKTRAAIIHELRSANPEGGESPHGSSRLSAPTVSEPEEKPSTSLSSINFSAQGYQVMVTAMVEARRLGQTFVASDCLFLALVHIGPVTALKVLQKLQVDVNAICNEIESKLETRSGAQEKPAGVPYTRETKAVLLRAAKEAAAMGNHEVGPEHILLGLLAEKASLCVGLLEVQGVTLERARDRVLGELGPLDQSSKASPKSPTEAPSASATAPEETRADSLGRSSSFTPRAQQVLALARREAENFHHAYVGAEHLFLALIAQGQGVAVNVIRSLNVDLEAVRQEVRNEPRKGSDAAPGNERLPYTPRFKKVLAIAGMEARNLGHSYIGTEHILLGLLRENGGALAQIFVRLNIEVERTRTMILKELDPRYEPEPVSESKPPPADPFYVEKQAPVVPVDNPGSGQEARINGPIVEMKLTNEPLSAPGLPREDESGAVVDFYGVVRNQEEGRPLAALEYEAYEPMARRELEDIVRRLAVVSPCHSVHLTHRLGVVPVGEPSLHVRVRAKHRAEAFAMASALIDEMKRSVPIWKKAVFEPVDAPPEQGGS